MRKHRKRDLSCPYEEVLKYELLKEYSKTSLQDFETPSNVEDIHKLIVHQKFTGNRYYVILLFIYLSLKNRTFESIVKQYGFYFDYSNHRIKSDFIISFEGFKYVDFYILTYETHKQYKENRKKVFRKYLRTIKKLISK